MPCRPATYPSTNARYSWLNAGTPHHQSLPEFPIATARTNLGKCKFSRTQIRMSPEESERFITTSGVHVLAMNLAEKLATFDAHWQPHVVGQFNGHDLLVVKVKGEFVWHSHAEGNVSTAEPRRVL